jgi:hypothetical protein
LTALSIANVSLGACTTLDDGAASVDDVPRFVVNADAPVNVSDVVPTACFRPDLSRPSRFACEAGSNATVVLFGVVPLGSESCPSTVHLREPNGSIAKLLWAGKSGNASVFSTVVAGAFQCVYREGAVVFEVATAAPCCTDDCAPWESRTAAPKQASRVDVLGAVLGASVAVLCCVVLVVWLLRRRRQQHEKA